MNNHALKALKGVLVLEANVLVLGLTSFVTSLGSGVWIWFLSLYVVKELHASSVELGLIYLISLLCFTAGGFLGFMADSIGRRPVISIGTCLLSAITLLMACSTTWIEIALLMGVMRLIQSSYMGSIMAMASESATPSRSGSALAFINLFSYAGLVPAPYLGSWLYMVYSSYQKLFAFGAILIAIAAIVRALTLRETLPKRTRPAIYMSEMKAKISIALKNTKLRWLVAFGGVYAFSANLTMGVYGLWILYASEVIGLSSHDIGLWGSIYQACFMATMLPAGKLIDKVGFKKALLICIPLEALASALFIHARGLAQVVAISLIDAISSSIDLVALQTSIALTSPIEYRAGALSLYSSVFYGSSAPSTYVGGHLYTYAKHMPFITSALLQALSAILLAFLLKKQKAE